MKYDIYITDIENYLGYSSDNSDSGLGIFMADSIDTDYTPDGWIKVSTLKLPLLSHTVEELTLKATEILAKEEKSFLANVELKQQEFKNRKANLLALTHRG